MVSFGSSPFPHRSSSLLRCSRGQKAGRKRNSHLSNSILHSLRQLILLHPSLRNQQFLCESFHDARILLEVGGRRGSRVARVKGVEAVGGSEGDVLDDGRRDVRNVPIWVGEEGHWEKRRKRRRVGLSVTGRRELEHDDEAGGADVLIVSLLNTPVGSLSSFKLLPRKTFNPAAFLTNSTISDSAIASSSNPTFVNTSARQILTDSRSSLALAL